MDLTRLYRLTVNGAATSCGCTPQDVAAHVPRTAAATLEIALELGAVNAANQILTRYGIHVTQEEAS